MFLCPLDEIGNDQEIPREFHLDDDIKLKFQPFTIGRGPILASVGRDRIGESLQRGDLGQPLGKACTGSGTQCRRFRIGIGHQRGENGLALRRRHRATLRDQQGILDRFRQIGEQHPHVGGRLHPRIGHAARAVRAFQIA